MEPTVPIDQTDHRILGLLCANGRTTISDMAREVAISATAVKRRIDRLQRLGVIRGYTAVVDYKKLGWAHEAFIEVRFTGTTDPQDMHRTIDRLPEAQAVFTTAGDQDAIVWVRATDMSHLTRVIGNLRRAPAIIGTRSHMVLAANIKASWHPPAESGET